MSDLISRQAVMDLIESKCVYESLGTEDETLIGAFELIIDISDLPTAYDVDKVWNEITDRAGKATTKGVYRTYWECAKIVKGGGQG